jgi:hypothetical protein
MRESLQDSITRLLRYQRVPPLATKAFRAWKHNSDILPKLQTQLEMMLDVYGKFEPVVYDTQGPRDDGSDVVLRYRQRDSNENFELICFQVKSFDDLAKGAYMQELKAQRDDSFRKVVGMRHYFLILCTDSEAHKDRVRNIMAEFRSADRTEVIEPAYAYTFLHHPKTRVEALIKRAMEEEDYVFQLARTSLELDSPSARALAIFMVVKSAFTGTSHFTIDEFLADPILRNIYEDLRAQQADLLEQSKQSIDWEDNDEDYPPVQLVDFEDQIAVDLEMLETDVVELERATQDVDLRLDRVRALNAVVMDAVARYEHNEAQLMSYMFTLMRVRD